MERRAAEELAPSGKNLLARRAALKADMEGAAALAGRLEEALGKMELKVEEVPESEPPAQAVSREQEQLAARLVRVLRSMSEGEWGALLAALRDAELLEPLEEGAADPSLAAVRAYELERLAAAAARELARVREANDTEAARLAEEAAAAAAAAAAGAEGA